MQLDVNVDCSRVDIVDVSVGICSSTSYESDPAAGQLQPAWLESSVDKSTPPMEAFRQKSAGTQRDLQGSFRVQGRRATQRFEEQTHL